VTRLLKQNRWDGAPPIILLSDAEDNLSHVTGKAIDMAARAEFVYPYHQHEYQRMKGKATRCWSVSQMQRGRAFFPFQMPTCQMRSFPFRRVAQPVRVPTSPRFAADGRYRTIAIWPR